MSEIEKVIAGKYCSGCGACTVGKGQMKINDYGEYIPEFASEDIAKSGVLDSICPFTSPSLNEDYLSKRFNPQNVNYVSGLGYYSAIYVGFVTEGSFRSNGTSGGMGSWLLAELLATGRVTGIIHVKAVEEKTEGGPLFEYAISRSLVAAESGAKSRYHVVEITKVMDEVRRVPGQYAFIGVPCFSKAVRRLQLNDPIINDRIKFVFSLVCGHLKSINWTYSLAWAAGINPRDLASFTYRVKDSSISPRAYVFKAESKVDSASTRIVDSATVVGGKFNAGAMMLNACDYCDDIVGETADASIGDAWLPRFEAESKGTNLLVVRNPIILEMIHNAKEEGRVLIEKVAEKEALSSQAGGIRHRREGLAYRLSLKARDNVWAPGKRVSASAKSVPFHRKILYRLRMWCARRSREVFEEAHKRENYPFYALKMSWRFKTLRIYEIMISSYRIINRKIQVYFSQR
jgi:coenzyme F420 hydrogenase subunit beta